MPRSRQNNVASTNGVNHVKGSGFSLICKLVMVPASAPVWAAGGMLDGFITLLFPFQDIQGTE